LVSLDIEKKEKELCILPQTIQEQPIIDITGDTTSLLVETITWTDGKIKVDP